MRIPDQDLPYIFEQFYSSEAHKSYSGSGLVLAIAATLLLYQVRVITYDKIYQYRLG